MHIEWTKESLEEFLKDKQERSVDKEEYLLLIGFINKIRPEVIIDIGTYKGSSGYILGTCCDSIKKVYSIDNINSSNYYPKEEATKEEHGIFLPTNAIFLKDGYENNLSNLVKNNKDTCFCFWDAGKNTMKVMMQLQMSHDLGIKYIAFHDTGEQQGTVRRAIKRSERFGWYKIISEDIIINPSKGVSILELIE